MKPMMTLKIPRELHTLVKIESAKVHMSIEAFVAAHLKNIIQNAKQNRNESNSND